MPSKATQKRSSSSGTVPPMPDMPLRDDMLLSFEEAAAYMRATARQVERWVYSGKLRGTPLPGRGTRLSGLDLRLAKEAGRASQRPVRPPAPRVKIANRRARASAR